MCRGLDGEAKSEEHDTRCYWKLTAPVSRVQEQIVDVLVTHIIVEIVVDVSVPRIIEDIVVDVPEPRMMKEAVLDAPVPVVKEICQGIRDISPGTSSERLGEPIADVPCPSKLHVGETSLFRCADRSRTMIFPTGVRKREGKRQAQVCPSGANILRFCGFSSPPMTFRRCA